MSSAISGSLNLSRAQSQIPISIATGAASNIQNFSTYDAVELIGYVFVDGSSADYRASVKLSIVKNGAGIYEVAASDIAGDDYSGSPIVSFSMSGSLLQATLDSALVAAESPSESYIRYALSAPAVGGQDNISIDASKIVTGTLDSGVLPLATGSSAGAIPFYEEGTWTPSVSSASGSLVNLQATSGNSITFGAARYTRVGNMVFASIDGISNVEIISDDVSSYMAIDTSGLPAIVVGTQYYGSSGVRALTQPREVLASVVTRRSASSTDVIILINADSSLVVNGEDLQIFNVSFTYYID